MSQLWGAAAFSRSRAMRVGHQLAYAIQRVPGGQILGFGNQVLRPFATFQWSASAGCSESCKSMAVGFQCRPAVLRRQQFIVAFHERHKGRRGSCQGTVPQRARTEVMPPAILPLGADS